MPKADIKADIAYTIIRREKRKTASIVIRPDNQIEVLAPSRMPTALIAQFIQDKSTWIHKKQHFNRHIRAQYQPKYFTEGELFYLLDKPYLLKITMGGKASVEMIAPHLLLTLTTQQADNAQALITHWYQQQALTHFQQRCYKWAKSVGKEPASVGVKSYKSRWGSCHHDGRIFFNWRLIIAPAQVIDYVVIHELCHLIHPDHSRAFWQRVEQIMPDFQQAKTWLKINACTLDL